MLSARQAKDIVNKTREDRIPELLETISKQIEALAKCGQVEYQFNITHFDIAYELKNALEKEGYNVSMKKYIHSEYKIGIMDLLVSWDLDE